MIDDAQNKILVNELEKNTFQRNYIEQSYGGSYSAILKGTFESHSSLWKYSEMRFISHNTKTEKILENKAHTLL